LARHKTERSREFITTQDNYRMLLDTKFLNMNWSDIMAAEEEAQTNVHIRMSAAEWKEEGKRIIRSWPRNRDLRECLSYLDRIDAARAAGPVAAPAPVARQPRTEFDIDFAIWRDMVECPSKYGDDICEWLELNEKLTNGPGRWRLGAFWDRMQTEQDAKDRLRAEMEEDWNQQKAATVIAAAVRGHQARTKQPFRDCCMCLSHRISPLETDVGHMCRGCAEQGPYTEETGPLADPWSEFRADYVGRPVVDWEGIREIEEGHKALFREMHPNLDRCLRETVDFILAQPRAPAPTPEPVPDLCRWCFSDLVDGQTDGFCDRDCEYSYMKETWSERR
jgi:hypothetical protein